MNDKERAIVTAQTIENITRQYTNGDQGRIKENLREIYAKLTGLTVQLDKIAETTKDKSIIRLLKEIDESKALIQLRLKEEEVDIEQMSKMIRTTLRKVKTI